MIRHYAIVCGASAPGLLRQAMRFDARLHPLLKGELDDATRRMSPYLIPLGDDGDAMTRWLLRRIGRRPIGVFCEADCGRQLLLEQVRRLLTVRTPEGDDVMFRFYDPTVFSVLVPSFNRKQLMEIFGPALAWSHLDYEHRCRTRYSLRNKRLIVEQEPWPIDCRTTNVLSWKGRR